MFYVSSRLSPLLPDDRLLPIRPHRHNLNRHPKLPLQERNVKIQLLRKLILRPDLRQITLPARQLRVHRLQALRQLKRKILRLLAPNLISSSNLNRIETAQHIPLHHNQLRNPVDHHTVLEGHQVEPATTARTPCSRTKLIPVFTHQIPIRIKKLSRERPRTHTGTVSLKNAIYLPNFIGGNAHTDAGTGTNSIRRSNKRVGTKINVEQRALGPFGQDGLALLQITVQLVFAVDQRKAPQVFDAFHQTRLKGSQVVFEIVHLQQTKVLGLEGRIFFFKVVQNVAHTQAVATGLVHVGGTDALKGGANFGGPFGSFRGSIQNAVGRSEERRVGKEWTSRWLTDL